MSSLLNKLKKVGSVNSVSLAESDFFSVKTLTDTKIPIINTAFSGSLNGGFTSGLTVISGQSKSFKTLLGLVCIKAYLDKYQDAVVIFYDSEFGVTPDYLNSVGIDTSRVLHIPIEHVEQLKFDMSKKLEEINKGDRVFFFVDSLGNLASKKEVEDAVNEKSVADMTRAKSIRSWLRIITPHLTTKDLPCIVINHVYQSMDFIPRNVIPGGTAVTYAATNIFVITKAQEKDGTDLTGYKYTITIEKSRLVREKSKFPFSVSFETGINKFSGLLDIAVESGHVVKPKQGWYSRVNTETGEIEDKSWRAKNMNTEEFWRPILDDPTFASYIEKHYKLQGALMGEPELDEIEEFMGEE